MAEKTGMFDCKAASTLMRDMRNAFNSGRTRSYEWRTIQLKMMIKLIDENEKLIIEALFKDMEKPGMEAFITEIVSIKSSCVDMVKQLKHWMVPEKAKTSFLTYPSSAEILPEPLGVVLIISSWNYPFLLSLDPVIGAIAAGNAVVLKPSEVSPSISSLLATLLPKYLDTSAVKVVEGSVSETTALLEQQWDKIFYTGNGKVGRIVMTAAARHLTPVVLELGGKSPVVVDSNINLKVAGERIAMGKWGCNNGQACIAVDYIITLKSFAPQLIKELRSVLLKFYGTNPLESKYLSRIVNLNHFSRLLRLMNDEKVSGKIVHGGQSDEKQLRIAPTILLDVPHDSLVMTEEIFGPLLPIITVDKIEEGISLIKRRPKPLAAYLFTNDKNLQEKFVSIVSAGGMVINDTVLHVATYTLPFGGVGESGMGSYHGKFSFDVFSHKKAILRRNFNGDSSMRFPPFTPKKKSILKALLNGDILGVILLLLGWRK